MATDDPLMVMVMVVSGWRMVMTFGQGWDGT